MSLRVLSLWNRVGSVVAARGTMNNSMAVVMQQQQQQQRGFASKKVSSTLLVVRGYTASTSLHLALSSSSSSHTQKLSIIN